ncbi:sulfotransferase family protein [Rubrobacter aplysinae]|uniref:sulfotransferase family protein n=1 Tax=Rubrobacter aplysinae TaxID=909625 RepID=UPI00064C038E|nr:sulfotransferase [Rubrobacter aplysinae]
MPLFEHFSSMEIARNLKAFLRLEAGVTRDGTPRANSRPDQSREIERLRGELARRGGEKPALGGGPGGGPRPENIVWIFSSGRSGTTWVRDMMRDLPGHWAWEEPRVGSFVGNFYNNSGPNQLKARNFILSETHRGVWMKAIRSLVLDGAAARFPDMGPEDYLVIKEPNGSEGAPLLMEALPESRMLFIVRDPRDVVSSTLDGAREGNWLYERNNKGNWRSARKADTEPDEFIKGPARRYQEKVSKAKEAYDAHEGRKAFVRYEELNADALGSMKRIYSELGLYVDERKLEQVVKKHSWENIPDKKKGDGKFYRKASPGGWKEDLTPQQVETVEKITAPLIEEYYTRSTS